jgi:hypothetical protein
MSTLPRTRIHAPIFVSCAATYHICQKSGLRLLSQNRTQICELSYTLLKVGPDNAEAILTRLLVASYHKESGQSSLA